MPTSSADIELNFRPKCYFWPLDLRTHVVSSVKGAARRTYVERMFADGREGELPEHVIQSSLEPELRQAVGALHPSFMGGEYLPDRQETEVEIARITIASTTQDVTCVYARRTKDCIHYRTVDEYDGGTLGEKTTRTSTLPLTLTELADFFLASWDLLAVLDMNFEDDRYSPENVLAFFDGSSEFYPDFGKLIAQRVKVWLRKKRTKIDEDSKEGDDGNPTSSD
jgi:hypothetical protein